MKNLLLVVVIGLSQNVWASGCDWDQSYIEETKVIDFQASGNLSCPSLTDCAFLMFGNGNAGRQLTLSDWQTTPTNLIDSDDLNLYNLKAQIIKQKEHGSCYNDVESLLVEVEINGVKVRNTFSVFYPPY